MSIIPYSQLPDAAQENIKDFLWGPRQKEYHKMKINYFQSRPSGAYGPKEAPWAAPRYYQKQVIKNINNRNYNAALNRKLAFAVQKYKGTELGDTLQSRSFYRRNRIEIDNQMRDRTNPVAQRLANEIYRDAFPPKGIQRSKRSIMIYEEPSKRQKK